MPPNKQRVLESLQTLILRNETQHDYLTAALDAAVAEDWDTADLYTKLATTAEEDMEVVASVMVSKAN